MSSFSVTNLLWLPAGRQFYVVRPYTLATNWDYKVVLVSDPLTVLDQSTVSIAAGQRHVIIDIDDRYDVDIEYRVYIYNNVPAIVAQGDFQVVRGKFDSTSTTLLTDINDQLALAAGLAGLNVKREVVTRDRVTGIPLEEDITVYTDETQSSILAVYKTKRRLNDSRQVVGEVMFQVSGSTSTSTSTGT